MSPGARKPLAITLGDPCGIGPEIVAKLFADRAFDDHAVVLGDPAPLQREIERLALPLRVALLDSLDPNDPMADFAVAASDAPEPDARIVPVLAPPGQPPLPADLPIGRVHAAAGAMAAAAVREGARLALRAEVAALVTAPLHKEALAAAGVRHPGHTEMLAEAAGLAAGDVAMMLANDELRSILVTIHLPLADAIGAVTRDAVLRTIRLAHRALEAGCRAERGAPPRIAVAGLNPHAGEGGLFGDEEMREIAPAVAAARAEGIDASGPWPGDTVFARARHFRDFDAVVAMYHDQGLIPVKYLGFETGVNVTLGLPFVRTSVDHGTAFDIAGRGVADHRSLLAAARMARRLLAER